MTTCRSCVYFAVAGSSVFSDPPAQATVLLEDADTVMRVVVDEIIVDVAQRWQVRLGSVETILVTSRYGYSVQSVLNSVAVLDNTIIGLYCTVHVR